MIALIAVLALAADPPLLRDPPTRGPTEAPPPILRQPPGGARPLMPVYGVSTDGEGVTVSLQPDGCNTLKSDFTVAISKSAERPTVLIARRSRAGSLVACKTQPHAIAITWTYSDLGLRPGQPFSLANPLVMAP